MSTPWRPLTATYPKILENPNTGDLYLQVSESDDMHRICMKLPIEIIVHADTQHEDLVNIGILVRTLSTHNPAEEPTKRPIGYGLARYLQSNHGMDITTTPQSAEAEVRVKHLQELWRLPTMNRAWTAEAVDCIIHGIESDLRDRRDIKHVFGNCDEHVREEIRGTWRAGIKQCLEGDYENLEQ